MPKPFILHRPTGLYVRFLIPQDLRAVVGSRFLVMSLGGLTGDRARLAAAQLAMALSQQFERLRLKDNHMKKEAALPRLWHPGRDATQWGAVERHRHC